MGTFLHQNITEMQQRSPGHHIEKLSWWHTPKLLWLSSSPPAHGGGGPRARPRLRVLHSIGVQHGNGNLATGGWGQEKQIQLCEAQGGTDVLFHEESMPLAHMKQEKASSVFPHTHRATWSPGIAPR